MSLPVQYAWLNSLVLPRIISEALKFYGLKETTGALNNPVIMGWAKELGLASTYSADSVPWCGLFAATVVRAAGFYAVTGPLWARNWATFGQPSPSPGLGDVLVFNREGGGGHVGFYIGEDADCYHVLGGNQGDSVSITRIKKGRMIAARRPIWRMAQPASVKPYHLKATGAVSNNEA